LVPLPYLLSRHDDKTYEVSTGPDVLSGRMRTADRGPPPAVGGRGLRRIGLFREISDLL
jgi:hypothetical protein